MKETVQTPRKLALTLGLALICLAFVAANVSAQTVTFGFQKGNLTTNSVVLDSGYNVLDGTVSDGNANTLLNSNSVYIAVGSFFRSGSPNGQQQNGFFAYDLTQLANFISANTTGNSSVSLASASFTILTASASSTGGGNNSWRLYQTDPFNASCTWSNYDGVNPWTTNAYQSLASPNDTVIYGYTGGGSANTSTYPLLNTNSIFLNGVGAGGSIVLKGSTNFFSAITNALARGDKTLYLTLNLPITAFAGGGDSRQTLAFSSTNLPAQRPLLQIAVNVNVTSGTSAWTGGGGNTSWTTANNWSPSGVPAAGAIINFNNFSTANLSTVLNQNFSINGLTVANPTGPVSIGGANSLTINSSSGIDLSAATQNLTITAPLGLGANQTWNVGTGRTLSIGGAVTGSGNLTITGAGKVSLSSANVLPTGAAAGTLALTGTLDLSGNAQTINALSGSGVLDNTAAGAVTVTLTNGSSSTFSGVIQNTGGDLAVVAAGSGSLTLSGANNTFRGGLTVSGGAVNPSGGANSIGTGTLTVNSNSTFYPVATVTFTNAVTLGGGTLRVGGGSSRLATYTGPVTLTGNSSLSCDGSTLGNTLANNVNLGSYTLTAGGGGTANTISGPISGNGGISVSSGLLVLSGSNSFSGGTTINGGALRPSNTNAIGIGTLTVNSGGIFYPTAGLNFTNPVTLNGGTLEIGGANGNVLGIRGPVTVTTNSTISADNGTYGVYISNGLDMGSGNHKLTSFNNTAGNGSSISGITGANGLIINTGPGNLWITGSNTFAGTFRATNGPLIFQTVYALQDATLDMNPADNGAAIFSTNCIIGALTGTRDLNLGAGASARNISIGNNNADTTYSGALTNGGSVTKIGTGTLTLSGVSTYTGGTTNIVGTLLIDGSIASATEVQSGATLGGSGTISNSLTLLSGAMVTNNQGSPLTVTGSLIANGNTMHVSTPSALGSGDYTLMTYDPTASSGSFNSAPVISGAGLASGATGTIVTGSGTVTLHVVVGSTANYPTNITSSVSGSTLTLSWPATHLGWYAQSNSVGLDSATSWHDVPGSESGTSLMITINPTKPKVFYRLSNTSQP